METRNNIKLIEREKISLDNAKLKIKKTLYGKEKKRLRGADFLTFFEEDKT